MKKEKVYIITDGCTGDYSIVKIFKEKEVAREYIKDNIKDLYDPFVEEWEVH